MSKLTSFMKTLISKYEIFKNLKKNDVFILFIIFILIALVFSQWYGEDNAFEEHVEDVIEHQVGINIDITPDSVEK